MVAAVGASVGLLHWFMVYILVAPGFFWEDSGGMELDGLFLRMFFLNLLVPGYTFIGATYDLTLFTIPLTILAMGLVARVLTSAAKESHAA